jgi:hypothetical protein
MVVGMGMAGNRTGNDSHSQMMEVGAPKKIAKKKGAQ